MKHFSLYLFTILLLSSLFGNSQSTTLLIQPSCPSDTTSCDAQNIANCIGPRPQFTCFSYLSFDYSDAINVLDSGAVGDGAFDNTAKLRELAAMEKTLYFPPNNVFLVHGAIDLLNGVYGGGTIRFTNETCFLVKADSVFVRDVTIESTLDTGKIAPFAISVTNRNHFELANCRLINTRIEHESDMEANVFGCSILNNEFIADFSPFPIDTIQNDIITLRGVDSAWFCNNQVQFTNVHRVAKIAESLASTFADEDSLSQISPWNARNIWVRDNIITGITNSQKQVIDLFDGTELFTLEHNYIEVKGFTSIIENKTGFTTDFVQNTVICNNILKNDNIIFSFQGSHGAKNLGHDSGFQNITAHNNCLEGLHPFLNPNKGLVDIRFFHEVNFTNNELSFQQSGNRFALSFFSNLRLNVRHNIIEDGGLKLALASTNHEDEMYRDSIRQIEVDSNQFINAYFSTLGTSIWVNCVGDDEGYLSIYGNHFYYDETDALNALVQLNKLNFDSVNVSCNIVEPDFVGLNGINYLPPASSKFIETSNTWNNDNCKTPTENVYYVTPDALATGTGARNCPWGLDTAVTKAVAGDIVYVLAGNYGDKTLTFPNSGTAIAPIHFIGCASFPAVGEVGQTDILIDFPMSSFEDFKNDNVGNYINVMPLLDGITKEGIAMAIGNRSYIHIQNFAITRYKTGIQSAVAGIAAENLHLKSIIGSDFANDRTAGCGCEVYNDNCPQKLGYGLEIYGNYHTIENCIMADASAYNIAVWGSNNKIQNCKTYGTKGTVNDLFDPTDYYIEIGGYNDVIGMNTIVDSCIAVREDEMPDLCHKGKGIGIKRGQKNTITNCITTDLDNEGFYAFGLTTTSNIFKNCITNDDNRDGNAFAIREGANKNSFINCRINDAGVGVRFKRDGGGHQNLFLNCYFDRPKVHVQIDKYGGFDAWTNCGVYADSTTCEEKSQLSNNLFINCLFLSARNESPSFGIFTIDNQVATNHTNKIINSTFYKIPTFRACSNSVSIDNPQNIFYNSNFTSCADSVNCCPDYETQAEIVPFHFEVENSIFFESGFNAASIFTDFEANENLNSDPLFIDSANDDYHLSPSSSAINAGKSPYDLIIATLGIDNAPSDIPFSDFEGLTRPQDCQYDIGIFEYNSMCNAVPSNGVGCNALLSDLTYLKGKYLSKTIIISNNQVQQGTSAELVAGEGITLKAGFHAEVGCDFIAKIEPCNNSDFQETKSTYRTKIKSPTNPSTKVFSIAPNPFSNVAQISINLAKAENINLFLFDNTGRTVKQLLSNTTSEEVPLTLTLNKGNLRPGLYWLYLHSSKGSYTEPIVVIE